MSARSQTPSRYPVSSWRWLLLDRKVVTRVAGTEPIDGVEPGGIVGYTPIGFQHGLFHWKFRRSYQLWRRVTTVDMPCNCHRNFLRRKPWATSPRCDKHGIQKLLNDLYREHPELKKSEAS